MRRVSEYRRTKTLSAQSKNSIVFDSAEFSKLSMVERKPVKKSLPLTSRDTAKRCFGSSEEFESLERSDNNAKGKLSTQKKSRSSKAFMTSDLPAPDNPVTNIIDLFNVKTFFHFTRSIRYVGGLHFF